MVEPAVVYIALALIRTLKPPHHDKVGMQGVIIFKAHLLLVIKFNELNIVKNMHRHCINTANSYYKVTFIT